jgi:hypothetical protein
MQQSWVTFKNVTQLFCKNTCRHCFCIVPLNNITSIMKNEVFTYNGSPITFQLGNGAAMINATEMAKPFGKVPAKWLELPSTLKFIESLAAIRKSDRSDLIKTINGVGTWMHEDVAIEFARWLAPAFASAMAI